MTRHWQQVDNIYSFEDFQPKFFTPDLHPNYYVTSVEMLAHLVLITTAWCLEGNQLNLQIVPYCNQLKIYRSFLMKLLNIKSKNVVTQLLLGVRTFCLTKTTMSTPIRRVGRFWDSSSQCNWRHISGRRRGLLWIPLEIGNQGQHFRQGIEKMR